MLNIWISQYVPYTQVIYLGRVRLTLPPPGVDAYGTGHRRVLLAGESSIRSLGDRSPPVESRGKAPDRRWGD